MNGGELLEALQRFRILPAAVIEDVAHAVPIARALREGGVGLMEVTFRNPSAAECVRRIRAEVPETVVGAGTLLTEAQVDEAIAAGASFGVTPGFNPAVVRHARARGFPLMPGVLSPGEMERALELGCHVVKFFPAEAAGGLAFVRAVAAPYAHTPLRLVPFGGIDERNLASYLSVPIVAAVGGSWLADRRLAAAERWDQIAAATQRAVAAARRAG